MAVNEAIPFYEEGDDLTGHCSAAVTGKRFLKISANRQSVRTVSDAVGGGNIVVAHADAAGRIVGVSSHDAPINTKVAVKRASKLVIPVTAGAALNAFQEVEVGAGGVAVPLDAGKAVGYVLADCANGADAQVCLY